MEDQQTNMPQATPNSGEDKTTAIIAYVTIIGFIIAIVLHGQKKTALGAFHLRQMLGIVVLGLTSYVLIFIPILGWIAMAVLGVINLIVWITGLIAAVNGEMKPGPILGAKYQAWFKNAFN
ncbi:MAG: hypothetical protein KDC00_14580 [Flavobacteriales bacterium]|nr:hypothetical protein [Flavobacteriales bacterium]MCB0782027.1 hypothetical protein [Flavobacteriales bacterium]